MSAGRGNRAEQRPDKFSIPALTISRGLRRGDREGPNANWEVLLRLQPSEHQVRRARDCEVTWRQRIDQAIGEVAGGSDKAADAIAMTKGNLRDIRYQTKLPAIVT